MVPAAGVYEQQCRFARFIWAYMRQHTRQELQLEPGMPACRTNKHHLLQKFHASAALLSRARTLGYIAFAHAPQSVARAAPRLWPEHNTLQNAQAKTFNVLCVYGATLLSLATRTFSAIACSFYRNCLQTCQNRHNVPLPLSDSQNPVLRWNYRRG